MLSMLLSKRFKMMLSNANAIKNVPVSFFLKESYVNINSNTKYYDHFIHSEYYRGNIFYGIANDIKRFTGYTAKIPACIEHGLYLGEYSNPVEGKESGLPATVTFGHRRVATLKNAGANPIAIGPYILYADVIKNLYEEVRSWLKSGSTLLVMPSHSTKDISSVYSIDQFITAVNQFASEHNFCNIIVNIYFRDCNPKVIEAYKSNGWLVVCAGHMCDPLFLRRLRTFIELSDCTLSNSFGTHVGYSVALNTPHVILGEKPKRVDLVRDNVTSKMLKTVDDEIDYISDFFRVDSLSISPQQIEIVNQYWGLDCVRGKEELRSLLEAAHLKMINWDNLY